MMLVTTSQMIVRVEGEEMDPKAARCPGGKEKRC